MAGPATRHVAAVRTLGSLKGKRILEIGSGHGVATRLLCDGMTSGHVVAIDRSAKMIAAIAGSCDVHMQSGRLSLIEGNFEDQRFDQPFDAIVAVNVDFSRHKDEGWAEAMILALRSEGQAVLVLEAPELSKVDLFTTCIAGTLSPLGFEVWSTLSGTSPFMAVVDARLTRT